MIIRRSRVRQRTIKARISLPFVTTVLAAVTILCWLFLLVTHIHVTIDGNHFETSIFQKESDFRIARSTNNEKQVDYHMVFSSSCSAQQNWESYVFFYHAFKVKQPGNVTRIASGCTENEAADLMNFHAAYISSLSDRFHLHLTPDYSRVRKDAAGFPYKYFNKPFGLRHWLETILGFGENIPPSNRTQDSVIILMDPDMILLRPLGHDFSREKSAIWAGNVSHDDMIVRHGNPISQQDGYLNERWMSLNISNITGDSASPALGVKKPQAPVNYNAGPPYLATARDMYSIVVKWTQFAPRVLDEYQKLFSEMFGYIIAAAHLRLPRTMLKSLVVSTTITADREGWAHIDKLPDALICNPPAEAKLPFLLHYCTRYWMGRFFWSKYRLRKDFISCNVPLLAVPPNVIEDYWVPVPPAGATRVPLDQEEHKPLKTRRQAKRELFMICGMVQRMNEAADYYKRNHCDENANFNKTYSFYDHPYY